ncbi:MAG: hypothetical protein HYV14_14105 [Elusimicrobia bacterium]|nr:hypothetical protein [Elusimicrobiota bacterium]
MRNPIFAALLCVLASIPARAASAETLTVRAVAWDRSWRPATDKEWGARVVAEVAAAAKEGADAVVFPERFSDGRDVPGILDAVRAAAGEDRLVVLGYAPHRNPGEDSAYGRAYILSGGTWQIMDKLDPTPAERAEKPPLKPGVRLPLFRFRGGTVAVLAASSLAKPEIAASLKKRGVQLVLVAAPAEDEEGSARLARSAAARAVELGAAVVTAPPSPAAPALRLPAQRGFGLEPPAPSGRDFRVPWRKLLDLRVVPEGSTEPRPFLESTHYQVEI